jgi:hypothetical protein
MIAIVPCWNSASVYGLVQLRPRAACLGSRHLSPVVPKVALHGACSLRAAGVRISRWRVGSHGDNSCVGYHAAACVDPNFNLPCTTIRILVRGNGAAAPSQTVTNRQTRAAQNRKKEENAQETAFPPPQSLSGLDNDRGHGATCSLRK